MATKYIIYDTKTGITYEYDNQDTAIQFLIDYLSYSGNQSFTITKLEESN